MADKAQLASQIRFGLERLSARNAHHEFEHLCRHLARARIASNVLPSTGPVSAGGDQGRDFETFRTYLAKSSIADRAFVALASAEVIAFASTLEVARSVASKIRKDVEAICSSGEKVDAVYCFCSADIPAAKRHEAVQWARDTYSIRLEVVDGNAISEMLADGDTFWLAERYLEVPGEIFPRPESKDAYEATLAKWRGVGEWLPNFANFSELRRSARRATVSSKQDVPFWVSLVEKFLVADGALRRHAIYEISVAVLRGMGSLDGQEERVRDYFSAVGGLEPSQIEDAAVLLLYCVGAVRHNATKFAIEEVAAAKKALIERSKALLGATDSANERSILLEQLGFLMLIPDRSWSDEPRLELALPWWRKLLDQVPRAPRFPLRRFADKINNLTDLSSSPAPLGKLLERLDSLVAARGGNSAAAELARDRAVSHLRRGHLLDAVGQAHLAKARWYAEETLRGSVLTILFLSRLYRELGMAVAGKQYALAAAFLAVTHERSQELVSHALVEGATCDFQMGAFVGYLELAGMALRAYALFSQRATDDELGDEVERTLQQVVLLRAVASRLGDDGRTLIERKIDELPLKLADFVPERFLAESGRSARTDDEVWTTCQEELDGPPLSDVGQRRELVFAALGVEWRFEWANYTEVTAAAEELVAALQVALVEVAMQKLDVCFLPTTVAIDVALNAGSSDPTVSDLSTGEGRRLGVTLAASPSLDNGVESYNAIAAVVFRLIFSVSLLGPEKQETLMEQLLKSGLMQKLFVARPYRELSARFAPEEIAARGALARPFSERTFEYRARGPMTWPRTLGSGYTEKGSKSAVATRYEKVPRQYPRTLRRLRSDPAFKATLGELRARGWKDWHVLIAIANVAINYRAQRLAMWNDPEALYRVASELGSRAEREDDLEVPVAEFGAEAMDGVLFASMGATLRMMGMKLPPGPLDRDAVVELLRVRYRYWDDDVQHADLFGEMSSSVKPVNSGRKARR